MIDWQSKKLAYEVRDPKLTGRGAVEKFAATFEGGREIAWFINGRFQFVDGIKTYAILLIDGAWKIVIENELTEPAKVVKTM